MSSAEGEHSSDRTPINSVSSWGRDAGHPLELSSDSLHSSFHSSQVPDVPDMGLARRGGKMSTAKATEAFEEASPAILARARYLNMVPARDMRSVSQEVDTRGPALNKTLHVTVSPSPQSKDEENEKLHELRRYARDFRRQHTTDAERFNWDSDDEDYGLAIGRLVVT
jgi:hypothetical protein